MYKQITLLLIFYVFLSMKFVTAFAVPLNIKCPIVSDIQQVNFDESRHFGDYNWAIGINKNTFNTLLEWSFGFYDILALNEATALNLAKKAMFTLHLQWGPVKDTDGTISCSYKSGEGYTAIIATPPAH